MTLPVNKLKQFGEYGLDPKGIVIHNTGVEWSAQRCFDWMAEETMTSQGAHYFVDDKEEIIVMPLDWKTWSTGKGNDYAFENCIAIEICDYDSNEKQEQAELNAVDLIKRLMNQYNLTTNELYYHIEFNEKVYCPHILLDKYKTKKEFIRRYFE